MSSVWMAPNTATGILTPSSRADATPYRSLITNRSSLVGYWRMDAVGGTTELDQSGNAHTATLTGTVTINQSGAIIDGDASEAFITNSYADIGDVATLKSLTAFSIEAWIYLTASVFPDGGTNWIIYRWETFNTSGFVFLVDGGTAKLTARTSQSGAFTDKTGNTALTTNTWYHVAFTFDGTTGRLYLNGVQDASAAFTAPVTNSNSITISNNSQGMVGRIDELAAYNVALTAAQVAADYRVGLGGAGIWGPNL